MKTVRIGGSFESWQAAARALLRERVTPDEVEWIEDPAAPPLTGPAEPSPADRSPGEPSAADPSPRVPRRYIELARRVAAAHSADKWSLLYRILWRIVHENHDLLEGRDPDVARLLELERELVPAPVATAVAVGSTPPTASRPLFDMPPPLPTAASLVPAGASLRELVVAAAGCTACELHRAASQTVFGRGPDTARVMLVGEQPGDQEDLQGAPFVGPAGQVLDRALGEAGLVRDEVYVTNVVKHFKFSQRGKRRLHETPRDPEILACRPWLEAELHSVQPAVLVCLGATAARAILGPWFRITRQRGEFFKTAFCPRTLATFHPSAVLRAQEPEDQERIYALLRDDLRAVAGAIRS